MDHRLICSWLELPPDHWPPDHYALLGLAPGEANVERIEQRVHERLVRLRQYQLSHPDEVTNAMNRLAQAFTCLTDPEAKKVYDAALAAPAAPTESQDAAQPAAPPPPPVRLPVPVAETAPPPGPADPLAWLFGPWSRPAADGGSTPSEPASATGEQKNEADWDAAPPPPQRLPLAAPDEGPPTANGTPAGPAAAPAEPAPAPEPPAPEPVDPIVEAAQSSPPARRGLGTKRALYYRVARTRQLLWAWEQTGKYLARANRKLTKPSEAKELKAQLEAIRHLLRRFPPLLGEAGQPGYLVVALARQEMIVQTFRTLLPSQRETLARDWKTGHDLLVAHRNFLRQELRALRQRSRFAQMTRAVRTVLVEQPGVVMLVLGLVALGVALWLSRSY